MRSARKILGNSFARLEPVSYSFSVAFLTAVFLLPMLSVGASDDRDYPESTRISVQRADSYNLSFIDWNIDHPVLKLVSSEDKWIVSKELIHLSSQNAYTEHVAISPDGKKVAYVKWNKQDSTWEVETMEFATESSKVIAAVGKDPTRPPQQLDWSPDGTRLVFVAPSGEALRWHINQISVEDGKVETLVPVYIKYPLNTLPCVRPRWFPKAGSNIVIYSAWDEEESTNRGALYIMDINSKDPKKIYVSKARFSYLCQPVPSHNGKRIAFVESNFVRRRDIPLGQRSNTFLVTASLDSDPLDHLVDIKVIDLIEDPGVGQVQWSPDDKTLVFVNSTFKDRERSIQTVSSQTGLEIIKEEEADNTNISQEKRKNPVTITTLVTLGYDTSNARPAWSPDGKMISYVSHPPGGNKSSIMIIPATGGEPTEIAKLQTWGRIVGSPHWWLRPPPPLDPEVSD